MYGLSYHSVVIMWTPIYIFSITGLFMYWNNDVVVDYLQEAKPIRHSSIYVSRIRDVCGCWIQFVRLVKWVECIKLYVTLGGCEKRAAGPDRDDGQDSEASGGIERRCGPEFGPASLFTPANFAIVQTQNNSGAEKKQQ